MCLERHFGLGFACKRMEPAWADNYNQVIGLAVVGAMASTGGSAVVVDEEDLTRATAMAHHATGIAVDATGAAGLAGYLVERRAPGEKVALLFTGTDRVLDDGL